MKPRAPTCTGVNRRLLSAIAVLAVLLTTGPVRAQQSFLFMDWFAILQPPWVEQYLADDASDDGVLLAENPDIFGDTFGRGGDLKVNQDVLLINTTSVLLAGGTRGLKPSEHNKAIPDNRVYFAYSHFHNAVATRIEEPLGVVVRNEESAIEQYLVGLESRFGNGLWSIELRMPFAGQHDFVFAGVRTAENHSGNIGNLSVLLKRLVYYDRDTSVVVGMGVETPTGSDFFSRTDAINLRISNDAVHLVPFVGLLHAPDDRWFLHGFVQVDVAANGNQITFVDAAGIGNGGKINDQTLLYVDVSLGRWFYRDQSAALITGVAGLVEAHYTGTLQNTEQIAAPLAPPPSGFTATNFANRMDVVNLTAAVHIEIARDTSLRAGGVFPITFGDNRFFDAEISAQLIRRF